MTMAEMRRDWRNGKVLPRPVPPSARPKRQAMESRRWAFLTVRYLKEWVGRWRRVRQDGDAYREVVLRKTIHDQAVNLEHWIQDTEGRAR